MDTVAILGISTIVATLVSAGVSAAITHNAAKIPASMAAADARKARAVELFLNFTSQEMLIARSKGLRVFTDYYYKEGGRERKDGVPEVVDLHDLFQSSDDKMALVALLNFYHAVETLLGKEQVDPDLTGTLFKPLIKEFWGEVGNRISSKHAYAREVIKSCECLHNRFA